MYIILSIARDAGVIYICVFVYVYVHIIFGIARDAAVIYICIYV